jgi:type II secretory pathway pseudopilin PulG
MIVGIVVLIALPNIRMVQTKARAAEVLGRIDLIQLAAADYRESAFSWPSDASVGEVPPELVGEIATDFFTGGDGYQLDWENVPVPGGLPGHPGLDRLVGVGVVTSDDDLAEALVQLAGSSAWYTVGSTYVFLYRDT